MSIDADERKQPRSLTIGAIVFIAVALTAGFYLGWERGYFGTSEDRPGQTAATAQSDGAPRKSTEKADATTARDATAAELARQRIANEILSATKEACHEIVADAKSFHTQLW